jgi:hypothetical protein
MLPEFFLQQLLSQLWRKGNSGKSGTMELTIAHGAHLEADFCLVKGRNREWVFKVSKGEKPLETVGMEG